MTGPADPESSDVSSAAQARARLLHARKPWARRTVVLLAQGMAAIAIGLASAWWAVRHAPWAGETMRLGAWTHSSLAGSVDADAYTRARVALLGLLALNREETMYYLAQEDDEGRPLRSRCRYRVVGQAPEARWWSLTAYAEDHFLFDDPQRRFSVNSESARLDAQQRFVVAVGQTADGDLPWLPTPGDRGVVLVLRLYNPAAAIAADPKRLQAPAIQRQGDCR